MFSVFRKIRLLTAYQEQYLVYSCRVRLPTFLSIAGPTSKS